MSLDPGTQPVPQGGWSEQIVTLDHATIVPPVENGFVQAAGILDRSGAYCPQGALWRKYRPLTTEPSSPAAPVDKLAGRWIWGGVMWAHFGHFLVESTSRLWAIDHLDGPVDGFVFMPKRPRAGESLRGFQTEFIDLLAPEMPVRVVAAPTEVDQLIVPGQGFGLGLITQGTDRFRDAIHTRFARDIQPEGPDRLYISRSALGPGKGGLVGEEKLEQFLQAEGYEVFHPEKFDLATQIARYKAARKVVAADGSALHLYAMVGRPDQDVAIILRRQSNANNLLAMNVSRFCGSDPLMISALRTEWVRAGKMKSNRLSFGELDHAAIGAALALGGFVDAGANWPSMSEDEQKQAFADKGLDKAKDFVESPAHVRARVRSIRQARRSGST